jgi:hypothetical protein
MIEKAIAFLANLTQEELDRLPPGTTPDFCCPMSPLVATRRAARSGGAKERCLVELAARPSEGIALQGGRC